MYFKESRVGSSTCLHGGLLLEALSPHTGSRVAPRLECEVMIMVRVMVMVMVRVMIRVKVRVGVRVRSRGMRCLGEFFGEVEGIGSFWYSRL